MRALSRVITQAYDDALRPHKLKTSQLNLLAAVGAHPGVQARDLGRALSMDASTLSRNLDALGRQGWVARHIGEDGRSQHLELTSEGVALVQKVERAWARVTDKLLARLGEGAKHTIDRYRTMIERD